MKLKLEVKGLSGRSVAVEVTPNEFKAMSGTPIDPNYRLCIVTDALSSAHRKLRVFEAADGRWVSSIGDVLIEELIAARSTLSTSAKTA